MKLHGDRGKDIEVSFGGYSVAGRKQLNEDAFAAYQPPPGTRHYKGAAACMADGVSCSENAQQASQTSVTQFIEDYYSTPDSWLVKKAAARVLSAMNAWLYHFGKQSGVPNNSLVTTFTALVCKSTTAHIFHVGDSRIYRLRHGALQQLSNDHCHSHLGKHKVFLTRALGMDSRLEVDYLQEPLQSGDVFLLTTDGLHQFIQPKVLQALVANHNGELEATARSLVAQALEQGSDDNVSCLLVRIDNVPQAEIDEVHRGLTRLAIPPVMAPGQRIDGYEILEVIHSGTRSHLYRVKNRDDERQYVLKAPSENFAEDPQYLEGFIREQWVGQTLNNPRVMKILPHPENSQFLYHICEYVRGQSLRQWMYDHPQAELESVRTLVKEIVSGLRAFQRMDMVHRDLKPENIMLDANGQVKLLDFGTVQAGGLEEIHSPLSEEIPMGSVGYIAPEYRLQLGASHVSDLFSLGVITYECLTGRLPFADALLRQRNRFSDWRYIAARESRQDIPPWVDMALKKACEADPHQRYQAFSEFVRDLCTPNQQMLRQQSQAPLIERHPLRFWQAVAAILFVVVVVQCVYLFA